MHQTPDSNFEFVASSWPCGGSAGGKLLSPSGGATTFGATFETLVLFRSLALTLNLAVYGRQGVLRALVF
jgi:hypothetical protein